jgi:hypothetical protein
MIKRKVLLIGACGTIAAVLLPALRERFDLKFIDIKSTDRQGNEVEGVQIADVLDPDRDKYRHHFSDVDAVIHCGFVAPRDRSDAEQNFWAEHANVQMAFNIYQVSLEEGVRRVVVASSNHAADYYERLILDHKMDFVSPDMRALSDNYYGWAKETYEHLGFVFAAGSMNAIDGRPRPLENVQIRIGGPRETDLAACKIGDLVCMRRALAVYISQDDMSQLFIKSVEAETIEDEFGVPFQIFYGISANSDAFWSIVNARKVIGYAPEENSELRFAALIAEHIEAANTLG